MYFHVKVIEASDLFAELFVTSVAMLESDYESEFVMATRLLEKVMGRLDLSKAENEEKLDNLFKKINWSNFPGVQALLMKVRWCDEVVLWVWWRREAQALVCCRAM